MIRLTLVAFLHLSVIAPLLAAENPVVTGSVEGISSDAWEISGFDSNIELSEAGLSGEFHLARVVLLESGRTFDDIRVACALIGLTTRSVTCTRATFTVNIPGAGRQSIRGAFTYFRDTGSADIELSSVLIAGGRVGCRITASEAGIDVRYSGKQLQLGEVFKLAAEFDDSFASYSASGLVDLTGTISMAAGEPPHIIVAANLDAASLANEAGTIAADGVKGKLDLDLTMGSGATYLDLAFTSNQGEAYLEPVYANFSEHALHLEAHDTITADFSVFDVRRFELRQDALLDVGGSATLSFPPDEADSIGITADVELRSSSVANLYTNLVKIEMAGTMLGNLETAGIVSGEVSIVDNALRSATLQLEDLILDDNRGRFAIYNLHGAVDWSADTNHVPDSSALRWDSGTVYNIVVGGGAVELELGDDDIQLLTPLRVTTLGGALLINELGLQNFSSDDASGSLDAELEPVQLGQLTGAFGWPAFSGTLSGRLPLLQLAENTVTVGGTLSANAFDGTVEMSKLRIEQPFGRVPRMQGELAFRGLDLQRLTEVFSFGLIQGRLSGDVAGLEMENWRPVAMDMHFYTPDGDKSERRISQRAVENLASVGGGGAAAVLSTGFLKFFDVFAYDRIGLRCVLENNVCTMSGAGAAKTAAQGKGYYLVKGRGVPRIDVVGYRDTVSWPRLLKQLVSITRSGSPTVN